MNLCVKDDGCTVILLLVTPENSKFFKNLFLKHLILATFELSLPIGYHSDAIFDLLEIFEYGTSHWSLFFVLID